MIKIEQLKQDIQLIDISSKVNLDSEDRTKLIEKYNLTNEILDYADDENERARLEFDDVNQIWLVVYYVQNELSKEDSTKATRPVALVIKENKLFLFTNKYTHYVKDYIMSADNHFPADIEDRIWALMFNSFDRISDDFSDTINDINNHRDRIQAHIERRKTNYTQIIDLANLQDSVIYVSSAINSDYSVARQIDTIANSKAETVNLTDKTKERLHDSVVEIEQIKDEADLASDVIDRVSNTSNNILDNQVNNTMKVLTIYTIVLSIPTIVSGFYGMNMGLPVADKKWSWVLSIIITIAMIIFVLWDLHRRNSL
ncbi:magnesium transporter CorA family protein [Companilactobacillus sp.]|jgi:Mg2+ and Co2+ transporter CorA|uniref:magnesium transporter CorA family protein n=1 Tax=Companilactobacillus sp. TaxID=2767905 RepID=UPI0025B89454|nr:magnesium transporter CorA family protein [Companilactobacillus sp.]MCH4008252.1 magnesium transporter CorA family protein [Companilactobacillus sp.]MCH4051569.1 magnesium transporter CorA family protein [Companilactobacillus sp.]MCH4076195.1 magnesium transporter CorA family protein [Companilactobacillus sp.]MCH4124770.1 magnesium transporter CorA family protein [Companilactobacillus sp.]MCH4131312.1 magnesium transporter CorA family protein [Companilactobacillus sp.]